MEIEPTVPEFARVWQRVQVTDPNPAPAPSPSMEQELFPLLNGQIASELNRRRIYLSLGLHPPAQSCLQRARRLGAACFLLTGQRPKPDPSGHRSRFPSLAEGIRAQYLDEQRCEEAYRRLAHNTSAPELGELLPELAQGCRSTRLWLRKQLEQIVNFR